MGGWVSQWLYCKSRFTLILTGTGQLELSLAKITFLWGNKDLIFFPIFEHFPYFDISHISTFPTFQYTQYLRISYMSIFPIFINFSYYPLFQYLNILRASSISNSVTFCFYERQLLYNSYRNWLSKQKVSKSHNLDRIIIWLVRLLAIFQYSQILNNIWQYLSISNYG